jgi:hypothetical protein
VEKGGKDKRIAELEAEIAKLRVKEQSWTTVEVVEAVKIADMVERLGDSRKSVKEPPDS